MPALTLKQPWAALVAMGSKSIEVRSWRTDYKGPIAIHAGKERDKDAVRQIHAACPWANPSLPIKLLVPGAIVATVWLKECVPFEAKHARDSLVGDLPPLPGSRMWWAWITDGHAHPLPTPIECRGRQGLWTLDDATMAAVRDRFKRKYDERRARDSEEA